MSFRRKIFRRAILLSAAFSLLGNAGFAANFSADNLKVNRLTAPLGLDEKIPYFGWQMKTDLSEPKNIQQNFYQIVVKDADGNIFWDSGKVSGGESQNIPYAGRELQPESFYTWTVTVWDGDGSTSSASSTFETGLNLSRQGTGDWNGAQWIGSNTLPLDAQSLSVFQIKTQVKIPKGSTRAAIVFGANDNRLMNAEKNMWKLSSKKNESRLEYALDISGAENSGLAKLQIFRHGYSAEDSDKPLVDFAIPSDIINEKNAHAFHEILLTSNHGIVAFGIDGKELEMPEANFWSKGFVVNPAGPGGDYISFPTVSDIGFSVGAGQKAEFKNFEVLNFREPGNAVFKESPSKKSIFGGMPGVSISGSTYKVDGGSSGILVTADPSHGAMPLLRTTFSLANKKISRARIYATARGIYDLHLNGERVTENYFAPELTQYDKTQLYQVYDVTKNLRGGENALGAQLAEGWWSGAITFTGASWNYFGDRQSLLAKLVVTYDDGTKQIITTQPGTWQFSEAGPLISGSFFQGEKYDARREKNISGWDMPGKLSGWQSAKKIPLDKTTGYFGTIIHPVTRVESRLDYSKLNLVGQEDGGVQAVERKVAESVRRVADKIFIYDMGQNLAGVPNIKISDGQSGTQVTMRFAEMLYPDNDSERGGTLMLENIRGALSTDNYILKGGDEVIAPRDTYHGYRYIEITGLDELPLDSVGATVLSSAKDLTANFECSDASVNRLYQNIVWSTRANFLSIPTDCPQRNERMGWSGDLSVFAPTASYLWDTDKFLSRHLQALRDLQDPSGRFGDIAPIGGGFGGINWGSVGLTVPYELYMQYGDKKMLADHYDAMKKYVDYLENHVGSNGVIDEGTIMQLGDWLGPENSKNDVSYLLAAAEINDINILAKSAEVLGKNSDANHYRNIFNSRRNFFNEKYFDKATHKSLNVDGGLMDTQTSYAVALGSNALNDSEKPFAEKYLVEAIERTNIDDDKVERPKYSLMTGFIGTAKINPALSRAGRADVAYKLLENHQYPSWLYPVDQGATTIWERLNSYTKANGFGGNNSMNSFNHYSFGAVGAWLYSDSLGIARDEENPGWKHFILQPQPDFSGGMSWAKGYFDSPYGRIESSWRLGDGGVMYDFTVPANTSADCKLIVPATSQNTSVTVNGSVQNIPVINGHVELKLIPGHWKIFVK